MIRCRSLRGDQSGGCGWRAWGGGNHRKKPERIRLPFSVEVATYIRERVWHPSQIIRERRDARWRCGSKPPGTGHSSAGCSLGCRTSRRWHRKALHHRVREKLRGRGDHGKSQGEILTFEMPLHRDIATHRGIGLLPAQGVQDVLAVRHLSRAFLFSRRGRGRPGSPRSNAHRMARWRVDTGSRSKAGCGRYNCPDSRGRGPC
jgi:hypothetical protein